MGVTADYAIDPKGVELVRAHRAETGHRKFAALGMPTLSSLLMALPFETIAFSCRECEWVRSREPFRWKDVAGIMGENGIESFEVTDE